MVRSAMLMRCTPVLLLVLALVACRQDAPATVTEAKEARIEISEFVLVDSGAEPWQGRPALYLRFSQPLAGAQHFDELLAVGGADDQAIEGSWMLDEDLATLRFPFVEAARDYRVEIDAGLMAADGRLIGDLEPLSLHSGPLPPSVGFASSGVVLPIRNSDGLPIVSVNVREVDIEFLRLKDARVPTFFANRPRSGQRGSWELEQIAAMADPVYAGRFALETRGGERAVSHIPVHTIAELREPGVYFAVMKRAGSFPWQQDTTFFFVSDLGMHVRGHADGLWVHVASLATGEAQSGVALEVQDAQGRRIASAGTDARGQARLDYRLQSGHVLLARRGRDVAWLPFNQPALDLSEFEVAGRPQRAAEVFLWSGRDLYRPGEAVRVMALLRDFDGRTLPAAQPLFGTLRQPDGRSFLSFRLEPEDLGFYQFQRALPADVPTGRWTVEMRLDPSASQAHASMTLRIEEFLPERLKLDLAAEERPLAPGETLPVQVEAAYLYGAPAAGNRFSARLLTAHEAHPLVELRGWHFGDPLQELPGEPVELGEIRLDDAGQGEVFLQAPAVAAGPLALVLSGSVFESGGRAVNRSLKRIVWPAPALVGVRPQFDLKEGAEVRSRAGFEIQRYGMDGSARGAGTLTARLVRERREYFWSFLPEGGWRSDFVRRFDVVESREVPLRAEGPARIEFNLDWGDYRLEVDDPDSGLTMRLPFRAGWGYSDLNRGDDARPDRVKLALDRDRYRAGEEVDLTITPPYPGPAVLLVESDRLLHSENFQARAGGKLKLKVTPEWERHDVYISVLTLRPGERGSRITPTRAVGMVHVPMDRSERRVEAHIEAPPSSRPGDRVGIDIHVPALAGKQARVALSAVDLGVINITRYPLPDAAAHFFARRGLGIEARDLYGRIIEDLAGRRARLRYGGDAALIAALPQARRPTAEIAIVDLFEGPVAVDGSGRARVEFTLPDFNGTLRLAALAFGESDYAAVETQMRVRAPLVVEASSPRVLAPGDRARLTIDVQNFSGAAGRLTLRAEGDALAEVLGRVEPVDLADGEKRTFGFDLRGGPGHGLGRMRIHAELGDNVIERAYTLPVRSPWPIERRSRQRKLEQPETLRFGADAVAGLQPGSAVLRVSASTLPPLPFAAAVEGLVGYPYGCLEQTASRAFALLWLDAEGAGRLGIAPVEEATRQRWLADAFARISSMQQANGHFSLWPGDGYPTTQLTPWIA
ncbi:MAG TPA: alpha-2-macroglobulin, partial [Xanthomonadaceae bacterium]|nr:alpha-2-macroglobulin [Xanthomonadaceae bacterium]